MRYGFLPAFVRFVSFAYAREPNSCYTFRGMNEPQDFTDVSILPRTLGLERGAGEDLRERRELLIFLRAERLFGIFADEASDVTQHIEPTPLPRAPPSVFGVVCVRGRMLTLLDPLALVDDKSARPPAQELSANGFVVALRGDEQLALAVDRVKQISEIFVEEIAPLGRTQSSRVIRGVLQHESSLVTILNVEELYTAAMHGAERRRRRSKN
jgi:chemotaxis signal transduction protein